MVFPVVGGNQSSGDIVTNSLRFNDGDSPSLSRDLSSPNTDKFTVSFWIKLTGERYQVASLGKRLTGETGDYTSITIDQGSIGSGRMGISGYDGVNDANTAAYNSNVGAGACLRDPAAWYHLVYAFDTGQGTAGNRLKWYVNGVLQSGYNTTTTPSQNADLFNSSGSMIRIGRALSDESRYGDGYIAEYYYVDGQQYDHTYFGEFNDNNVWVPVKNGSGAGGAITFGTNGFYLQFKETGTSANSSGIGADTSGNDNHLTPANLTAQDITTDTPQNNFCTINPLYKDSGNNIVQAAFSEGNTQMTTTVDGWKFGRGTFLLESGKWYSEVKCTETGNGQTGNFGIVPSQGGVFLGNTDDNDVFEGIRINLGGSDTQLMKLDTGTGSAVQTFADGSTAMLAVDLDNNKIWVGTNGTWWNDDNASTTLDASNHDIALPSYASPGGWLVAVGQSRNGSDNITWQYNWGNPPNAISSGNADANGYGNFEYAVPSGFYALCTKNLAEYG